MRLTVYREWGSGRQLPQVSARLTHGPLGFLGRVQSLHPGVGAVEMGEGGQCGLRMGMETPISGVMPSYSPGKAVQLTLDKQVPVSLGMRRG